MVAVTALALAGCSPLYRNHGYVPDNAALAQVTVGADTRATVEEALGPPVTSGVMGDRVWLWVSYRTRTIGAAAPRELNRSIVAITFTENDRVANVERLDLEDGRPVAFSRRVTDTNIAQITLWQQILRNIGQFNPADFIGQE
jgi:outer membrane protein assembly factor BamE (lipoprotein component of BamABCDE complex)